MEKIEFPEVALSGLAEVARQIIVKKRTPYLLFLGEMGAGKTTFVGTLANELGVEDNIGSPTFSLVNEYQTSDGQTLYHFDFYRIDDEEEALDIGIYDYFDSGSLCLMEWPQKIIGLLPEKVDVIKISGEGPTRGISFFPETNPTLYI